jgi:hypothetical protein
MKKEKIETTIKEKIETVREVVINAWMEKLVRMGFGARGLIYFMMGLVAFQVAYGTRTAPEDQQGALTVFATQPLGRILLVLVLIGLIGYSLWGLIRIIFDPLQIGSDPKGIVQRLWYFSSVASYASLIIPTWGLITHHPSTARSASQTAETQKSVSTILQYAWGPWVIGMAGLIGIGIGLGQIYEGLRPKFDRQFRMYDLSPYQAKWLKWIGRIGTAARGIVFIFLGLFLALAAYYVNPQQAQGIDGALLFLGRQPYGFWLLGLIGLGLMAFGIYSFMGMFWFRMKKNEEG